MLIKTVLVFLWQLSKRPYLLLKGNHVPLSSRIDSRCTLRFSTIGKYCFIRSGAQFNHVITGNYCSFAADVQIGGMEHPITEYSTSAKLFRDECVSDMDTIIGNDVWIAAGAIIRQGVRIGNGAVVGANSFVNKDVPPYAIVAGSPAHIIKYRFEKEIQEMIANSGYWNLPPKKAKLVLKSLPHRI